MDIALRIDCKELGAEGIDSETIRKDLEAEMLKLSRELGTEAKKDVIPVDDEAHAGEPDIITWILDLATDPKMAVFYAKALIFAVNQILNSVEGNRKDDKIGKKDKAKKRDWIPVKIRVFGNTLVLPATILAIQEFLSSLGDE